MQSTKAALLAHRSGSPTLPHDILFFSAQNHYASAKMIYGRLLVVNGVPVTGSGVTIQESSSVTDGYEINAMHAVD